MSAGIGAVTVRNVLNLIPPMRADIAIIGPMRTKIVGSVNS